MGRNKSFVTLDTHKMIEVVLSILDKGFARSDILIVTNTPDEYSYLGTRLTEDRVKGRGPLGGLEAALSLVDTPYVFMAACDMPFLNWQIIEFMAGELQDSDDILIPCGEDGRLETLHAIYGKRCLERICYHLEHSKPKLTAFFPESKVHYLDKKMLLKFDPALRCFSNINTPEELDEAQRIIKDQSCFKLIDKL